MKMTPIVNGTIGVWPCGCGCSLVGGGEPPAVALRFQNSSQAHCLLLPEDMNVELSTASPAPCLCATMLPAMLTMEQTFTLVKQPQCNVFLYKSCHGPLLASLLLLLPSSSLLSPSRRAQISGDGEDFACSFLAFVYH